MRGCCASDGEGTDFTVCCHGHSGGTLASMVVEPGTGTMWVAEGAPCTAAYERIPFLGREEAARPATEARAAAAAPAAR